MSTVARWIPRRGPAGSTVWTSHPDRPATLPAGNTALVHPLEKEGLSWLSFNAFSYWGWWQSCLSQPPRTLHFYLCS